MELGLRLLFFVALLAALVAAGAYLFGTLSATGTAQMEELQQAQRLPDSLYTLGGTSLLSLILENVFGGGSGATLAGAKLPIWSWVVMFVGGFAAFYLAFIIVRIVRAIFG